MSANDLTNLSVSDAEQVLVGSLRVPRLAHVDEIESSLAKLGGMLP